jgi:hypothetical protein
MDYEDGDGDQYSFSIHTMSIYDPLEEYKVTAIIQFNVTEKQ